MDQQTKIGKHAGEVWKSLQSNGLSTPAEIAERTTLMVGEVNQALGWLAREAKLAGEVSGRRVKYRLDF